jgi:hypothetical protein
MEEIYLTVIAAVLPVLIASAALLVNGTRALSTRSHIVPLAQAQVVQKGSARHCRWFSHSSTAKQSRSLLIGQDAPFTAAAIYQSV